MSHVLLDGWMEGQRRKMTNGWIYWLTVTSCACITFRGLLHLPLRPRSPLWLIFSIHSRTPTQIHTFSCFTFQWRNSLLCINLSSIEISTLLSTFFNHPFTQPTDNPSTHPPIHSSVLFSLSIVSRELGGFHLEIGTLKFRVLDKFLANRSDKGNECRDWKECQWVSDWKEWRWVSD